MVSLLEIDAGEAICGLNGAVSDLAAALTLSNTRPRPLALNASAVANASGNAVIVFDACPGDQIWSLRRLVVGGVTWGTTAIGTAVIALSSAPNSYQGNPANIPLTDVVDEASSLPDVAFYDGDPHLITLAQRQCLVVGVASGTSGQQYVAAAQFDLYPLN